MTVWVGHTVCSPLQVTEHGGISFCFNALILSLLSYLFLWAIFLLFSSDVSHIVQCMLVLANLMSYVLNVELLASEVSDGYKPFGPESSQEFNFQCFQNTTSKEFLYE